MAARSKYLKQPLPMYGWALNREKQPVPIAEARRGERYFCPVCGEEMVAKKGMIKQHHFAHASERDCGADSTPVELPRRWLANVLREKLLQGETLPTTWHSASTDDDDTHRFDLLRGVEQVQEELPLLDEIADVALQAASGQARAALFTGLEQYPSQDLITRFNAEQVVVVLLNPIAMRSGHITRATLLERAKVWGGWWLLERGTLPANIIVDNKTLRSLLRLAVNKPPYRFYGLLHRVDGMDDILNLEGRLLWLPPEVWESVVGGTRNRLGNGVTIITQELMQDDYSKIGLFYITARDEHAVALRYFPPGEPVTLDLGSSAFRMAKTTALDLAQQLAGGLISYPQ